MNRTLSWTATQEDADKTIEQFLRARGCSHHVLTHLKQTERGILLNGRWAYTNQKLTAEDVLTIQLVEEQSSAEIMPVQMPLDIVYEDEDLLVVNKPSDMPIHPSINNYENTLANGIMYYFASQGIPCVYRCINRLDRDTSGLLILAKHMMSGAILSRMSASRQIHREYLAIVEGILPKSGTIDAPIARLEGSVLMRCVDYAHGQRAVTHFRRLAVLDCASDCLIEDCASSRFISDHASSRIADFKTSQRFDSPSPAAPGASSPSPAALGTFSPSPAAPGAPSPSPAASGTLSLSPAAPGTPQPQYLSLAAVTLETGRTHQIRVHMSHIGHPLAGDFLYNPSCAQPTFSGNSMDAQSASSCNPSCAQPTFSGNSTDAQPASPIPPAPAHSIRRQALHSHKLEFTHPITGQPLSFLCEMPEDMRNLLKPTGSK